MKISMSNLKNFDFKQFGIDHGEKVVVGLVGLFVVYAMFGVRWMPYKRTPQEMQDLAKEATTTLENNTWPETQRKQYQSEPNVMVRADALLKSVEANKYSFVVAPFGPIIEPKKKNTEPKWLPPENAIATTGRVPVVFPLKQAPEVAPPTDEEKKKLEDENVPEEYRSRDGEKVVAQSRTGGVTGKALAVGGGFGKGDSGGSRKQEREAFNKQQKQEKAKRRSKRDKDDDDSAKFRQREAASSRGRGMRFVSVRTVVPIARQYIMLARAFHEQVLARPSATLRLLDFELERQEMNSDGTWTEWRPVNRKTATDLLMEAQGSDPEVVNPIVTDPVITMPLPPRSAGIWSKSVASHPDVENFALPDEVMELYLDFQERIIRAKEESEKSIKKDPKDEQVAPGGFSDLAYNMRDVGRELQAEKGTLKEGQNKLQDVVKEFVGDENDKQRQALIEKIQSSITVDGQLFLFRYFDFEVKPGYAYRYRVQVVFNNPSYGLGLDRVNDPSVSTGPLRPSGWSDPTNPVIVPDDSKLFLTDVKEGKNFKEPKADIDMYEWYADLGTMINKTISTDLGQFVGGKQETAVIDPAKYLYKEKAPVFFHSDDVLVDVIENPSLNYEEHPDLGFTKPLKGGQLDLTNQALLVDEFGDLASLDPVSTADERKTQMDIMGYQAKLFETLIKEEQARLEAEKLGTEDKEKGSAGRHGGKDDDGGGGGSRGGFKRKRNNPMMKRGGGGAMKNAPKGGKRVK